MKNLYKFIAICISEFYGASAENPLTVCEKTYTNKAEAKKDILHNLHLRNLIDEYTLTNETTGEVIIHYKRKHGRG